VPQPDLSRFGANGQPVSLGGDSNAGDGRSG
jgi:hypothetical protein